MTGSGNILQHGVYPCFNRWLCRCGTWNDFSLQILQVVAIEVKPALKRPIRHPPFALEEVENLGQDFIIRHMRSSTTQQPLSL